MRSLAARGRLLARDHGESHRSAGLQAAGCRARPERHDDPSDPHRCGGPHGARGRIGSRGAREAARHHRLRNTHRRVRLRADGALQRRIHQSTGGARDDRGGRRMRAASASGYSPWTRISTRTSRAASPMCCSARPTRKGDHILAARFLSRFVPKAIPWLHLDLAGRHASRRPRAHRHAKSPASACATRSSCCAVAGRPDAMSVLTIRRPDDWHLHLRDGAALASVVEFTAERFGRAIVMPNLKPPVATAAAARAYRDACSRRCRRRAPSRRS